MSRVEKLWERLVRAALRKERTGGDAYEHPVGGIVGNVPAALSKNSDIDEILRVADGIQDEDPNISRICMFFTTCFVLLMYFLFIFLILILTPV
ncbi:putative 1,3-beta-glucan synthase [Lupinus albus]|uniref:Putative 1,3-beta-glucan synthase n=1 Tax=Lupinus albus TaxID=3870 RepID=A0A6A4QYQ2_LUPAL|nr:putative 1,3-beta-glucan synthase [Lupinus albus]